MSSPVGRFALLALAMVIVFLAVAAILMRIIPGPHKDTDFLVIGTVATFASLATLFLVLISTSMKDSGALFLKRKKE